MGRAQITSAMQVVTRCALGEKVRRTPIGASYGSVRGQATCHADASTHDALHVLFRAQDISRTALPRAVDRHFGARDLKNPIYTRNTSWETHSTCKAGMPRTSPAGHRYHGHITETSQMARDENDRHERNRHSSGAHERGGQRAGGRDGWSGAGDYDGNRGADDGGRWGQGRSEQLRGEGGHAGSSSGRTGGQMGGVRSGGEYGGGSDYGEGAWDEGSYNGRSYGQGSYNQRPGAQGQQGARRSHGEPWGAQGWGSSSRGSERGQQGRDRQPGYGNTGGDNYGGGGFGGGGGYGSSGLGGGYQADGQAAGGSIPQQQNHAGRGPKGWQRSDDRIGEDVNEQLERHPQIDASEIEVKVEHAEVTLSGSATDRRSKRLAEDVAEAVSGVRDVHNQIKVPRQGESGQSTPSASSRNDERNAR